MSADPRLDVLYPGDDSGAARAAWADHPWPVDAVERQVALYASSAQLRPQLRRKREALDAAVLEGAETLGIDRLVDLATVSLELTEHADHWYGARGELARLWPDRERWKPAGQLAESPVWETP